jgi:hypothetical protein
MGVPKTPRPGSEPPQESVYPGDILPMGVPKTPKKKFQNVVDKQMRMAA